jgi:hypothetical protein
MKRIILLLKKLWANIRYAFAKLTPELKDILKHSTAIVERIKDFIASPTADLLTAIIPSEIDDVIKKKLRQILPILFTQLQLVNKCAGETDPNKIIACALETLSQLDTDIQNAYFHSIAVMIAQILADGKLNWADAVTIVQWYYDNFVKMKLK